MSIAIVEINNQKVNTVSKLISALNGKIRVLTNQDVYEKQIMLKLLEESEQTKLIPKSEAKKYFLKYGIKI